jgi:pyridoxamine 5'-phosphate oxidase
MRSPDPIVAFAEVFARAAATAPAPPADHTAVALATTDRDGRPSVRVVLVRHVDHAGFVFYSNYESRKASELETNPRAALCFYWYWIEEQVRVEGPVTRATPEESDAYFASRPRGSQIGAWASQQSRALSNRAELEDRYRALERQFANAVVPRPPFWGGYRLIPESVEFWVAGAYRLHDRVLYTREAGGWKTQVLYP